jgi:tetratricopeptide (TPR) repeat protein
MMLSQTTATTVFCICLVQIAGYDINDNDADHIGHAIELDEGGDTTGALASFRAATKFTPQVSESWHNLGIALSAEKVHPALPNTVEAMACFQTALQIEPDNEDVHEGIEDVANSGSHFDRMMLNLLALEAMEAHESPTAHRFTGKDPGMLQSEAIETANTGQFTLAAVKFASAVRAGPESAPAWMNLGTVLMDLARSNSKVELMYKSIWAYERAIKRDAHNKAIREAIKIFHGVVLGAFPDMECNHAVICPEKQGKKTKKRKEFKLSTDLKHMTSPASEVCVYVRLIGEGYSPLYSPLYCSEHYVWFMH